MQYKYSLSFSVFLQYFSKLSYIIITTGGIFLTKEVSNVTSISKRVTLTPSTGTEALPRHHFSQSKIDDMNHGLKYLLSIHCGRGLA